MSTVLEILLSVFASGVGGAILIALTVRQQVRRSNQLVAGRLSPAPAAWLWSPRRAAVLHRRLRSSCQVALGVVTATAAPPAPRRRWPRRSAAPPPSPFERIAGELIAQAVDIDSRLVEADRLDGVWRRQTLAELAKEVSSVEASARRMASLGSSWQAQLGAAPESPDLTARLDALEAALGELHRPAP